MTDSRGAFVSYCQKSENTNFWYTVYEKTWHGQCIRINDCRHMKKANECDVYPQLSKTISFLIDLATMAFFKQ